MTEDEEFEDLERRLKPPVATIQPEEEVLYLLGWNSALNMAAALLVRDLHKAFPKDTLASFGAYLLGMKK